MLNALLSLPAVAGECFRSRLGEGGFSMSAFQFFSISAVSGMFRYDPILPTKCVGKRAPLVELPLIGAINLKEK